MIDGRAAVFAVTALLQAVAAVALFRGARVATTDAPRRMRLAAGCMVLAALCSLFIVLDRLV